MAKTILGISLGTRIMGIAVMQDSELRNYSVKVFKQRWSKEKQKQILICIEKIIEYYDAKTIALKSGDPLRTSKQLHQLSEKLKSHLKKKKIASYSYSLTTVKLGLGIKVRNKNDFMYQIAERYPQLRKKYLKEINNRHSYYEKIFEAIAVAKWFERNSDI